MTAPVAPKNPFTPMFKMARADGKVTGAEMERMIAFANRGGVTEAEKQALGASLKSKLNEGKLDPKAQAMAEKFLAGKGSAAKGAGVDGLLAKAAADGKIDRAEARDIAEAVRRFGVSDGEKAKLTEALQAERYRDVFEPDARAVLEKLVAPRASPPEGTPAQDPATRRLISVMRAGGEIDPAEVGRLIGAVKRDGVSEAERATLSAAIKSLGPRLPPPLAARLEKLIAAE